MAEDEESKRARQLEEARKRVEELKKKKNSKQKKKGKKSQVVDEPKTDAAAAEGTVEQQDESVTEPSEAEGISKIGDTDSIEKEQIPEKETEEPAVGQEDNLFGFNDDKTPDFISVIEQAKTEDEKTELQAQLDAANEEIKRLKFTNMEQESALDESREAIEALKRELLVSQNQAAAYERELAQVKQELEKKPVTGPSHIDFAQFNVNSGNDGHNLQAAASSNPVIQPTKTDRNELKKWKDWNIDMTAWRSIGSGPIVNF